MLTTGESVTVKCTLPFKVADWSQLSPGDKVFFLTVKERPHADSFARGPFIVVNPETKEMKTPAGWVIKFAGLEQVLVPDVN